MIMKTNSHDDHFMARRYAQMHGSQEVGNGSLAEKMIGRALKAQFDDIASEPIPDKFRLLLAQLEAREQGDAG